MNLSHAFSFCSILITIAVTAIGATSAAQRPDRSTNLYLDSSDGRDWPGYGRTFGQQHFSPLTQLNQANVRRLGLAWSMDLGPQNSATQPIAVDGVLYFATGLSVVNAVEAKSGTLLWRFDPGAAEHAGLRLRNAWGTRGIAWWNDRIFTGTQDGRLIAIDAKHGTPVWSVQTLDDGTVGHINGAPRVFNGKVIVGFGTNSRYASRGYVTAYEADTGRRLWRFYTVPGNPADGFENDAMAMAAKTWSGSWWKLGGGANVWNAIAYDAETDSVFLGTGSGFPIPHSKRSDGRGDNLFVASIVALEGETGRYKWHYQVNPGDTRDFDATMDIELAEFVIHGKTRKVLMQAPKNGFFYVIDRLNGQLISAEPYTKVTWASRIDLKTGRPVEDAGMRALGNAAMGFRFLPYQGAHNWMPMAYSLKTRIAYIPVIEGNRFAAEDRVSERTPGTASIGLTAAESQHRRASSDLSGTLVAWNPATQTAIWRVSHPTFINGGVLATGGNLIFQGTVDGLFKAYSATTGQVLWSFDAQSPLVATPISYSVNGEQYITLLTGLGMGLIANAGGMGERVEQYGIDPRSQARRVLTFVLDGTTALPRVQVVPSLPDDPDFTPDGGSTLAGQKLYARHCEICHGTSAIGSIHAPDLRWSAVPLAAEAFTAIVRDGVLVPKGMPKFNELTDTEVSDLRRYIRTESQRLRGRLGVH